jgi:hypothetical protein
MEEEARRELWVKEEHKRRERQKDKKGRQATKDRELVRA